MNSSTKKRILISVIILMAASAVLYALPIRFGITKTVPAQVIESINSGAASATEMTIDGTYTFYIFKPDRFEGSVKIAAFPETSGRTVDLKLTSEPDSLIYRNWQGSKLDSMMFGMICADFAMNSIIILKTDANGAIDLTGEQTCVILAGNASADDARKMLNDLSK